MQHLSDEQLIRILGTDTGDAKQAFELLYTRHASRVYTYCRRMMNNSVTAEDIFQETFVRLYNAVQANKGNVANAGAYILRIARNLCLNEKQKKYNSAISLEDIELPATTPTYETAELAQLLDTALATLPDEYREALVLKEHLGLSYNEIADVLSTTMPVVRTRIHRAKGKLKDILAPYLEDLQR